MQVYLLALLLAGLSTLSVASLYANTILVRCNIPDARVKIDSRDYGQTDSQGLAFISGISPGSHTIVIARKDYESYSGNVVVKEKLTAIVQATLIALDLTPPEIKLLSPEPSRGIIITPARKATQVTCLARDESGVKSVLVNGITASASAPSTEEMKLLPGKTLKFTAELPLAIGSNTIRIEAIDTAGNSGKLEQEIIGEEEKSILVKLNMGCRALLIGINNYENWGKLNNPITDIQALDQELRENYSFQTQVLVDAGRSEILSAIRSYYSQQFSDNDELLIVLSGHGHFDELSKNGYFISVDGKKSKDDPNFETYIAYPTVKNLITNIPCKHILLIIDACFAGTFFQDIAMKGEEDLYRELPPQEMIIRKMQYKTRLLLTSGGKEYVPDGAPGSHSPFMRRFLEGLRNYGGKDKILGVDEIKVNYMNRVAPQPFLQDFEGNEPGSNFLFIAK